MRYDVSFVGASDPGLLSVGDLFEIGHFVSCMSEFDKEAEREKLRKQFEQDERKRESTQRMSELLLQGATMTDTHCDTCGDPLFRHEGQEFCPSCQSRTDDQQPTADAEQAPTVDAEQAPETTETAESSEATRIEVGDGTTSPAESTESTPTTPSPDAPESPPTPDTRSDSDLSAARQSLVATITRFAKHAEATEDPDRARAFLAATEDAATALDAVDQATR